MKQSNIKPGQKLASLMLAAILSDTVGFKSSTTTNVDKEYGEELAKIGQISNINSFTQEIFKAKSNLSKLTDRQIVSNDYKIYEFSGKKVFINQLETVEQEELIKNKKNDLLKALAIIKQEQKIDFAFVAITDLLKVNTKLLILSDDETNLAEKAFDIKTANSSLDIGPKMSRKKEIAPAIEKALI